MDFLTLPRLHQSIPMELASSEGEAFFHRVLVERLNEGYAIPARRPGWGPADAVQHLLNSRLDTPGELDLMAGELQLAFEVDGENCETDDLAFAWFGNYSERGDGAIWIRPGYDRLEKACPGLGTTFLAHLNIASDVMFSAILTTPDSILQEFDGIQWDSLLETSRGKGMQLSEIDEEVRSHYVEMMECDPDDEEYIVLPSDLINDLGGGLPEAIWRSRTPTVTVTPELLEAAGFARARAELIARAVQRDLPRAIKKFKRYRRLAGFSGTNYQTYPLIVSLTEELCPRAANLLDENIENRMNASYPSYTFQVASKARAARTVNGRLDYQTGEQVDAIDVIASLLNLVRHVETLVLAMRG